MRNALLRKRVCMALLALLAMPVVSPADKKDDMLIEIQRDIGQLDEKVRDVQKAQATQAATIEALRSLIQQAATMSTQASQDMAALKTALTSSLSGALADQQTKISGAVAPLGSRMDDLSTSVKQLDSTIQALNERLSRMEKKVNDIDDQVSTLKQPPPAPPPAPGTTTDTTSNTGAPPGVTPIGLQQAATLDYTGGKDEIALMELANYVKYWPMDSWSPTAGLWIGKIYMREKDYESATQAFQDVIDKYPGNNMAQEAMFQKGMSFALWAGHRTEAVAALRNFMDTYPANENYATAKGELAKLNASSAAGKGKRPPGKQ